MLIQHFVLQGWASSLCLSSESQPHITHALTQVCLASRKGLGELHNEQDSFIKPGSISCFPAHPRHNNSMPPGPLALFKHKGLLMNLGDGSGRSHQAVTGEGQGAAGDGS